MDERARRYVLDAVAETGDTNSVAAGASAADAAPMTSAPPPSDGAAEDPDRGAAESARRAISAPTTMPVVQVEAKTPYPIAGWFSVSFAKKTSATLSVAANRTIPRHRDE